MYFVVDADREVSPQQAALVWQRLWEMRDLAPISAVLPAAVSSPCPLLPDEAASAVVVPVQAQVPEDSAWVPLEVDLCGYLAGSGELRLASLDAVLRARVAEGERRHDAGNWASQAQRHDSWLNRRLAIFVRGWGDVVARRKLDPSSIAALREVRTLANHVLNTAGTRSGDGCALAPRRGRQRIAPPQPLDAIAVGCVPAVWTGRPALPEPASDYCVREFGFVSSRRRHQSLEHQ
jgi:hypothetical protein